MTSWRTTAKRISALLRKQGLYTSVTDLSLKYPAAAAIWNDPYIHVIVYMDKKKVYPVGAIKVHKHGQIEVDGDPALKELIEP